MCSSVLNRTPLHIVPHSIALTHPTTLLTRHDATQQHRENQQARSFRWRVTRSTDSSEPGCNSTNFQSLKPSWEVFPGELFVSRTPEIDPVDDVKGSILEIVSTQCTSSYVQSSLWQDSFTSTAWTTATEFLRAELKKSVAEPIISAHNVTAPNFRFLDCLKWRIRC